MSGAVGVVVMSYGSPSSPDEIEEYYTHIRRGRPPTDEQLAELRDRYEQIGGVSPLRERTEAQVRAIAHGLDELRPDRYLTRSAFKHSPPFIEDVVTGLVADGVDQLAALVLAPHYSRGSVGEYLERAVAAAGQTPVATVESWHLEPALLDFLTAEVKRVRDELPAASKVVFTAHSLPERVLVDDPYPDQLHESAEAVARAAGLPTWGGWATAWQSAGRTPEPWRGPDILTVIGDLADTGRAEGIAVCPQGFVADHLEVLFDLDIEARHLAEERGLRFARTRSINDDAAVMAALAGKVHEAVTSHG